MKNESYFSVDNVLLVCYIWLLGMLTEFPPADEEDTEIEATEDDATATEDTEEDEDDVDDAKAIKRKAVSQKKAKSKVGLQYFIHQGISSVVL